MANISLPGAGDLTDSMRNLRLYLRKYAQLEEDALVIGIDFGTTYAQEGTNATSRYSGVAWASLPDFQNHFINSITRWPGEGKEKGKTPTQIYYEGGKVLWGYAVPGDADPVRWFKLLLLQHEDMEPRLQRSEYVLRARSMIEGLGKTPVDVVSDYLKAIWEHALMCITKARGAAVVQGLQFHVVLTIPAIWKSYARQAMTDAAKKAGILRDRDAGPTSLIFAPEPEAAALATFADKALHPMLKPGETHIICDAGGGTVDLISYKVKSVNPTRMSEAVEGTGGLCGGIFIDQKFESCCKVKFGRRWFKINPMDVKNFMSKEWEFGVKRQFKMSSEDMWPITVPPSAFDSTSEKNDTSTEPVLRDGTLFFKKPLVRTLFDSQINEVRKLVRSQLQSAQERNQKVTGIILVGGLGSSPYLYEVLNEDHTKQGINVIQADGEQPWTAICRGAVYKGFLDSGSIPISGPQPVEIVSKVSRMHLGFKCSERFDEDIHAGAPKVWDSDEQCWFAAEQMKWLVRRGEDITTKSESRGDLYRTYDSKADYKRTFIQYFWQCEDRSAPRTCNDTAKPLCSVTFNVTKKWESLEDLVDVNGRKVRGKKKLDYAVVMIPSGSSVDVAVLIDGVGQGSQTVNIEFERGNE
ncbi:hypothetical protein QBC37DRAFT_381046 [Rhypophila decipiens]|uniref:Actin-like ATPase domain-containing protein n=1 Tax=Rhypophila decipiens TaxID=261697 RepID=A0AAN6XTV0_9PEZI|nr:hypothetical protein QBC37DRAFT_381046 [Rhypophila decipiens]